MITRWGGSRVVRVMLSCPYSLSLFGGVQGQVLGLARALRARRRRRPHHRPVRRPAARAGHHHRRAEHARAEQRLGRADRQPAGPSPGAPSRRCARSEPDVLHLHEPFSPGPNHAALVGTTIPAVGTFHSARAGRNGWYETFRSRPASR